MAVTRSTAAERMLKRSRGAPGIFFERRGQERAWLLAASVVTLLGLMLVYRAKTYPLAEFEDQFRNKQLLNLNEVTNRGELLPFLKIFDHPSDRQFVARKIFEYLREHHSSPVPNVGTLAKIRVGKKEIDSTR